MKPNFILTTSLALLAGLANSLPMHASECVLTDDITAPPAFYHTQLPCASRASGSPAGVCFDGSVMWIANETRNHLPRR